MEKTIKWGILGCGLIAKRFAESCLDLKDIKIVAAASNTPGKAREFASTHSIENYYTDYDSLLNNKDVDIVYIATTHNFHFENAKVVLNAGKHILCEKPFTVNGAEMKELIKIANDKKLFMMEAMWTRFLPAMGQIREWLSNKVIGEIKQIHAAFGYRANFDPENRLFNVDLAGGALLDIGIYPLSFANMVMRDKPIEIKAIGEIGSTSVDEHSCYILKYKSGALASLSSAINTNLLSRAEIIGTKGKIVVPKEFYGAQEVILELEGQESLIKHLPFNQDRGFKFEIEAASKTIRDGKTDNEIMPISDTLQLMETIDEIKRQLGLVYKNDCI